MGPAAVIPPSQPPPAPPVRAAIAWAVPTAELNKKVELYALPAEAQRARTWERAKERSYEARGARLPAPAAVVDTALTSASQVPVDLPMLDVAINVAGFRRFLGRAEPLHPGLMVASAAGSSGTTASRAGGAASEGAQLVASAAIMAGEAPRSGGHAGVSQALRLAPEPPPVGDVHATAAGAAPPSLRAVGAPTAATIEQKTRAAVDALASAAAAAAAAAVPPPAPPLDILRVGTSRPAAPLPELPARQAGGVPPATSSSAHGRPPRRRASHDGSSGRGDVRYHVAPALPPPAAAAPHTDAMRTSAPQLPSRALPSLPPPPPPAPPAAYDGAAVGVYDAGGADEDDALSVHSLSDAPDAAAAAAAAAADDDAAERDGSVSPSDWAVLPPRRHA